MVKAAIHILPLRGRLREFGWLRCNTLRIDEARQRQQHCGSRAARPLLHSSHAHRISRNHWRRAGQAILIQLGIEQTTAMSSHAERQLFALSLPEPDSPLTAHERSSNELSSCLKPAARPPYIVRRHLGRVADSRILADMSLLAVMMRKECIGVERETCEIPSEIPTV